MEGSASRNLVEISMLDFQGDGPCFKVQPAQLASDVFGVVQQEVVQNGTVDRILCQGAFGTDRFGR